jgi:Cys-tRNA(Pro) deacylase
MPKSPHVSETPATRWLKERGVPFAEHFYEYVEHGGAAVAAQALGVAPMQIVKTLVMQDQAQRPLLVLMPGDRRVSTRSLARQARRKRIEPCSVQAAQRHTGYPVGGTSPFATRKALPVFVERSVLDLARIYINGGRRGYLVSLASSVLTEQLAASPVDCAQDG